MQHWRLIHNSETAWRCFWHSVIKNFQTTVNAAGNLLTGVLQSSRYIVHHTQAKLMELEPYTLMRCTHTQLKNQFIHFSSFLSSYSLSGLLWGSQDSDYLYIPNSSCMIYYESDNFWVVKSVNHIMYQSNFNRRISIAA